MHTGKEGWNGSVDGQRGGSNTILLSLCLQDVLTGHFPTPYAFYGEVCHGGQSLVNKNTVS